MMLAIVICRDAFEQFQPLDCVADRYNAGCRRWCCERKMINKGSSERCEWWWAEVRNARTQLPLSGLATVGVLRAFFLVTTKDRHEHAASSEVFPTIATDWPASDHSATVTDFPGSSLFLLLSVSTRSRPATVHHTVTAIARPPYLVSSHYRRAFRDDHSETNIAGAASFCTATPLRHNMHLALPARCQPANCQ